MSKVHIVTDSAATITPEVAEQLGITVIPLSIQFDEDSAEQKSTVVDIYRDGSEVDHEELLLRMGSNRVHPRIVGPTAAEFHRIYARLTRQTNQIISLHSSASLSPICHEAQKAAHEFLGRCDIVVIDSETISLGLSILVQEAAQLTKESLPLGEVMRQIRGIIPRIYTVLITDTLDYLEHSYLISPTQAILGAMLNIRPFLAIEEGQIIPMEKVRSRDRAIDKLAEFASEFVSIEQIAILQSTPYPTDQTKMLQERLDSIVTNREIPILLYGPLLASHIGPDGMGLIVYEGKGRKILF